ncbi:MAG: SH3 domain-containing protein [Polyangiaceae bacterium]
MSYMVRAAIALAALIALPILSAGCSAAPGDADSEELVGADETVGSSEDGVSGSIASGTTLVATANVNLRTQSSTSSTVLKVVPDGATVVVLESAPSNGFYKVKHNGTTGWTFGEYYQVGDAPPDGDDDGPDDSSQPTSKREAAMQRARNAKGFSYWWGHGRFRDEGPTSSTKGSCSGSCPSCSHKGSYGADCSGLVAKVWQVPSSNDELSVDDHPYSTASFNDDTGLWSTVSRGSLKMADAMVYRSGSAGHVFVYEKGDGWGSMYAYECKGCSYGCVAGFRTASSSFHGIRRAGY